MVAGAPSSLDNELMSKAPIADPVRNVGSYSYKRKQKSQNTNQKNFTDPNDKESTIHKFHGDFITRYLSLPNALKEDGFLEPDWHEKNKALFETDWDRCNFIHRAIKQLRNELPEQILDVIGRMVVEKPDSFTIFDSHERSPLLHAANFNADILFFVVDILIPETIVSQIHTPCSDDGKNCPLTDIFEGRKRQCLIDSNVSLQARCLHDQMDTNKLVEENQKLYMTLQKALAPFAEQAYPCLESILRAENFDEANFDIGEGEISENTWIEPFKSFLQLCPNSVFNYAPPRKLTPLQMAVDLYKTEALHYDLLFEVIQAFIERAPWSIFTVTGLREKATTAYNIVRGLKSLDESPRNEQIAQAEELLKRACIGYQGQIWDIKANRLTDKITSEEKMSYLYSKVEHEKQFCLNLTGESGVIDRKYIGIIKKYSRLRFETAMEFVRLPYWKPQRPEKMKESSNDIIDEQSIELDPYIDLFQYMWDQGTQKIFLLDVDDDGPEPHTNASIREALQGEGSESHSPPTFEIETWKWKKFDICAETVAIAAPTARHVWLWSSGNTAVLRGWACGPGLGAMKQLESLTVVISPKNSRDAEDCIKYSETFKLEVSKQCKRLLREKIEINVHSLYHQPYETYGEGAPHASNHASQKVYQKTKKPGDWIQELYLFKQFIVNLARKSKVEVKVAVIDDGCRLTEFNTDTEPTGKSFCADDRVYFSGRCEHGTSMARCIREVCPTASLYIARLDVTHILENQAFTVESCCKALKWAIAVGVDVVCMSWTFPIKGPGKDSYEDEFRELVREAQEKKIVLFGSLPDRGPGVQRSDLAPIGYDEVIRIGSATIHGEGMPENRFGEAEFLLPGEESGEGEERVKGSSYATAYASGLAAAILLTIRLLKNYSNDSKHDAIQLAEETARSKRGMKGIFERLTQGDSAHQTMNNYVRPYLTLGRKADDFNNSEVGKEQTLRKIVHNFLLRDMDGFSG